MGRNSTFTTPFADAALGLNSGTQVKRNGFAAAIPVTMSTIWDGNTVYPKPSSGGTLSLVSTSAQDSNYAFSVLTLTDDVADGDTVTIGEKAYAFQDDLTDSDGNVHIAGAQATALLTLTQDMANNDTVTLGAKTYTFQTTLTNVDGNVKLSAPVAATGILTATETFLDGETITLDAVVYTFQNTLTDSDGNVAIASTGATETLTFASDVENDETFSIGGQAYTFKDVLTGAADEIAIGSEQASETLTLTADLQDGDIVTLGATAYTFQNTLVDTANNIQLGSTVGTGVLTLTDDLSDGDTVTLGAKTYTFQETLTNFDGNVHIGSTPATGILTASTEVIDGDTVTVGSQTYIFQDVLGGADTVKISSVKASKRLTLTTNITDTKTVTVAGKVYTFQATLTNSDGNVHIGASASDTIENLIAAIKLTGGVPGTDYATAMTLNTDATAQTGPGDTMDAIAKLAGTAGNSLTIAEDDANASWAGDATELSGGTSDVSGTLDNLIAALNAAAGSGTKYGSGTTANTSAKGAAGAGDTIDITGVISGATGNSVTTIETSDNLSFGAGTLSGGVTDIETTLDNFAAAVTGGAGSGIAYAAAMNTSTEVTASNGAGSTLDVSALIAGTAGNSLDTTEGSALASFASATLSGGTDDADTTITNFVAAINGTVGAGTLYGTGTSANASITAVDGTGTTIDVTAILNGTAGNSIVSIEDSGQASFTDTSLSGGTNDTAQTVTNTVAAIMDTGVEGTNYGVGTVVNPDVTAVDGAGNTVDVTAKAFGDIGNSVSLTDATKATWGGVFLSGGSDDVSGTLDNLIAHINDTGGGGYAASGSIHATVNAAAGVGDTVDIAADSGGTAGNSIASTETCANASFVASTLSGGTDGKDETIANFVAAVTGGAGSGTVYAAAMTTSTEVRAAAGASGTMLVTALAHGTDGNALDSLEASAFASFPAATLLGGTDDASGTLDNLIAAINGTGTPGTDYATSMTTSTTYTGVAGAGITALIEAIVAGSAGEAIIVAESGGASSFSPTDNLTLGTGTRSVDVFGLTATTYDENSETISLKGITPVLTSGSYIRQFDTIQKSAGSSGVAAGDITSTRDSDIISKLLTGNIRTFQSNYTIPAGKEGLVFECIVSAAEAADLTAETVSKTAQDAFNVEENKTPLFESQITLIGMNPTRLVAQEDFEVRANTGADTVVASTSYIVILI